MVAASKTRELTYASGGAGSPGHLVMESLLATSGAKMVHVPYKGPAPAMQDLLGGQVDCGFRAGPTVFPQVQSGKLIALATSGKTRSALAPELPTIAESGFPEFDGTFWILLAAPKGVPPAVQKRFVDAMNEADRKSTRLNSSHLVISYAVFCLKKKIHPSPHSLGALVEGDHHRSARLATVERRIRPVGSALRGGWDPCRKNVHQDIRCARLLLT